MSDSLDPKLKNLETKLRALKPYAVTVSPPPRKTRWYRIAACFLATAATALIVCFFPQEPGASAPGVAALEKTPAHRGLTPPALEMFSLRRQLLDELQVGKKIEEPKPEYPVVEIVVCNTPKEPGTQRSAVLGPIRGLRRSTDFVPGSFTMDKPEGETL